MGIVSGIVVFLMIWWIMIFTVLPFNLKRDETGKPDDPKLMQKFWVTTAISALVWLAVYLTIQSDIISFHDMAELMAEKDYEQ